jgi:hypothetical protein
MVKGETIMSKLPHTKLVVALLLFVLFLLLMIPFVRAEDPPKANQHYLDLTKQHFDLAVTQFDQKDLFAACSNLRISKSYARHAGDKIVYEHITLLLDKMCSGNS